MHGHRAYRSADSAPAVTGPGPPGPARARPAPRGGRPPEAAGPHHAGHPTHRVALGSR